MLSSCTTLEGTFGGFFNRGGQGVGGKGIVLKFVEAPENNEEITEGIPFSIRIEVENNIVSDRGLTGELCLRDELSDNFGGITTNQCKTVNLPPATQIDNKVTPSVDSYFFGPYTYRNLQKDLSIQTKITADMKYEVEAVAGSTACVKRPVAQSTSIPQNCGGRQDLQIQQPDLPVKVDSVSAKAQTASDTESNLLLDITVSKATTGQLVTKGNVIGTVAAPGSADVDFEVIINNQISAICSGVANNRLQIRQNENQKIIKCSAKLSLNQDYIQVPITIKMGYGFIQPVDGPTIKLVKEAL